MPVRYECESLTADHLFIPSPPHNALRGNFLEIIWHNIESFALSIIKLLWRIGLPTIVSGVCGFLDSTVYDVRVFSYRNQIR